MLAAFPSGHRVSLSWDPHVRVMSLVRIAIRPHSDSNHRNLSTKKNFVVRLRMSGDTGAVRVNGGSINGTASDQMRSCQDMS